MATMRMTMTPSLTTQTLLRRGQQCYRGPRLRSRPSFSTAWRSCGRRPKAGVALQQLPCASEKIMSRLGLPGMDCFGLASDNGDGQICVRRCRLTALREVQGVSIFEGPGSRCCPWKQILRRIIYLKMFTDSSDNFELSAIAYTKDRIDHWVADLRTLVAPSSKYQVDRKISS